MTALLAQLRAETTMTLRRGESLLLVVGIPVLLLVFFSEVSVVAVPSASRVDFIAPGILALSVMSTAMVSLSISTGFERGYGVLRRLQVTPLGTGRLLGAKVASIALVEILQFVVIGLVAVLLGFAGHAGTSSVPVLIASVLGVVALATAGFAGIGLTLAGTLKAEVNLAAANGLYLVFLLLGGMVIPLSKLPSGVATFAKLLPPAALSDALHALLSFHHAVPGSDWIVLGCWAVLAPAVAMKVFRFDA